MKRYFAPVIWLVSCATALGQVGRPADGDRIAVPVSKRVASVAIAEKRIACLLSDGDILVIGALDGRIIRKMGENRPSATSIAIDASGERVATAGIARMVAADPNAGGQMIIGDGRLLNLSDHLDREVVDRFLLLGVPRRTPKIGGGPDLEPKGGFLDLRRVSDGGEVRSNDDLPSPIVGLSFGGTGIVLVDEKFNMQKLDKFFTSSVMLKNDMPVFTDRYPAAQVVFGGDGSKAACLSDGKDGRIAILSLDAGSGRRCSHERRVSSSPPWAIAAAPDGRSFATCGRKGAIDLWGFGTRSPLRMVEPDGEGNADATFIAFSRDSKSIITAGSDGIVRVRDAGSGRQIFAAKGPDRDLRAAWLSGTGLTLVSGAYRHSGATIEPLSVWTFKVDALVSP